MTKKDVGTEVKLEVEQLEERIAPGALNIGTPHGNGAPDTIDAGHSGDITVVVVPGVGASAGRTP